MKRRKRVVEEERSGRRGKGGRGYQPQLPQFLTASREINLARMAPFLDRPTPDWLMTLDDLQLFT
jgi:hypothetical protein